MFSSLFLPFVPVEHCTCPALLHKNTELNYFNPFFRPVSPRTTPSIQFRSTRQSKGTFYIAKQGKSRRPTTMFSNILTTLLVCLVALTSAFPAASTLQVLPRDASAEPVALALPAANAGSEVAIVHYFNTTSTNANVITGAKNCQTTASILRLEVDQCYSVPNEYLGLKISAAVSGCKGESYHSVSATRNLKIISNIRYQSWATQPQTVQTITNKSQLAALMSAVTLARHWLLSKLYVDHGFGHHTMMTRGSLIIDPLVAMEQLASGTTMTSNHWN